MLAAEGGPADVRVGRQRAEADRVTVERDAAQLVEPPQVEDPVRRLTELARQGDHQVRAAGDRSGRPGPVCEPRVRLGEVARRRDGRLDRHPAQRPRRVRDRPRASSTSEATMPNPIASCFGETAPRSAGSPALTEIEGSAVGGSPRSGASGVATGCGPLPFVGTAIRAEAAGIGWGPPPAGRAPPPAWG